MSTRQNTSGFTMFELLIVIALGAIVLTMAVPSFQNSIHNQRLVTATNELVMAFTLAKSEAIKRVAYVSVCKSSDGATCTSNATSWNEGWIVFANANSATPGSFDAGDELIRVYQALPATLSISTSGNVSAFVSFRPSGTLGTNAANILGTLTTCDQRGADFATALLMRPSGRWQVSHDKTHDDSALSCS